MPTLINQISKKLHKNLNFQHLLGKKTENFSIIGQTAQIGKGHMATTLFSQACPSSSWPGLPTEVTRLTPVGRTLLLLLKPREAMPGFFSLRKATGGQHWAVTEARPPASD